VTVQDTAVGAAAEADVVAAKGDATGRLTGVNHIQLIVRDMREGVRFYRDVLGLRLIRTYGRYVPPADIPGARTVEKNYYFELGNSEIITLIEVPDFTPPDQSVFVPSYWPGERVSPDSPDKFDHLALNVATRADLEWFREHLDANGVTVSKLFEPTGMKLVTSIYFYDPSGNPLEIATFDLTGSVWEGHNPADRDQWLDAEPVPELFA
jgi:catechol 2,3-dioxygenase-like lactoylglutathione lyase family enzyme